MKNFAIAKKLNMTSHFLESGTVIPVTILQASPLVVTQVKTTEKDKYEAIQVGYGKKKNANKPTLGHLKANGPFSVLKEFKADKAADYQVGQIITPTFEIGEVVHVTGIMKGRGFAGAMKRHGFHGMPASHGHDKPRAVGSIGQRFPQHVRKGLRMAGHMGVVGVTVKNLQIVEVDAKRNLIAVKGAVPGHRNSIIQVVSAGSVMPLEFVPKATDKKKK
jgi:large subunit ribosomal protein L3